MVALHLALEVGGLLGQPTDGGAQTTQRRHTVRKVALISCVEFVVDVTGPALPGGPHRAGGVLAGRECGFRRRDGDLAPRQRICSGTAVETHRGPRHSIVHGHPHSQYTKG